MGNRDMKKALTADEGGVRKRSPAAVSTRRCWTLVMLTVVTVVTGHLFMLYNSSMVSTKLWSRLPDSKFLMTWFNSSLLGEQEVHIFLDIEEDGRVACNGSCVDTAFRGTDVGGGGENGTVRRVLCPAYPANLVGRWKVDTNPPTLEEQELAHPELALGGHFLPRNCTARHTVAIIIPYRNRRSHLTVLIRHLHPFLQHQQIEYNIYVVEQAGVDPFNRGMLMNVGFVEAMKQFAFDCIILHDVDLVPEDDRNYYMCLQPPRHMSVAISSHKYRMPYSTYFGGVSAMTADQFRAINGFSNQFWGWGGEDDDFFNRVKHKKLNVSRYSSEEGRYTMLSHKKSKPSPTRFQKLRTGNKRFETDGLSSLKYQILKTEKRHLCTWMLVALPRR